MNGQSCCFLSFMSVHKEIKTMVENETPAASKSTSSLDLSFADNCIHYQQKEKNKTKQEVHGFIWRDGLWKGGT